MHTDCSALFTWHNFKCIDTVEPPTTIAEFLLGAANKLLSVNSNGLYSGTPKCGHLWDLEKVS